MFRELLQKSLIFAKLYEEKQDPKLLSDCENVPEYKEILKILNKLTIKDLCLDDKTIKESFVPDHVSAATVFETTMLSIGYFFLPAGMYDFQFNLCILKILRSLSLHDHPGMVVTSKILMGEIKRRALDLVDREKQFELPLNPVFDIEDQPYGGVR